LKLCIEIVEIKASPSFIALSAPNHERHPTRHELLKEGQFVVLLAEHKYLDHTLPEGLPVLPCQRAAVLNSKMGRSSHARSSLIKAAKSFNYEDWGTFRSGY
jgi:hypothetical protein